MLEEIKKIAEENGVELTENAPKIAKARENMKCPLTKCICEPNNPERFCISKKCMEEIKTNSICHCRCFRLKEKNTDD